MNFVECFIENKIEKISKIKKEKIENPSGKKLFSWLIFMVE